MIDLEGAVVIPIKKWQFWLVPILLLSSLWLFNLGGGWLSEYHISDNHYLLWPTKKVFAIVSAYIASFGLLIYAALGILNLFISKGCTRGLTIATSGIFIYFKGQPCYISWNDISEITYESGFDTRISSEATIFIKYSKVTYIPRLFLPKPFRYILGFRGNTLVINERWLFKSAMNELFLIINEGKCRFEKDRLV